MRAGLGKLVHRPALGLRVMVAAILDGSLMPAFVGLKNGVGGGAVSSCTGDDPDCRDLLPTRAEASGVLFVPAKMLPQLQAWEPIVGKASLARILALSRKGSKFIFAAHRSPKSTIYVFVGRSEQDFVDLVDALVHAEGAFIELLR